MIKPFLQEKCFFYRKVVGKIIDRPGGEFRIENSLKIWYSELCERYYQISNIVQGLAEEDEDKGLRSKSDDLTFQSAIWDSDKEVTMEQYKQEFIRFMVDSQVLKFGDFTLKSGRKSPFFMNAGAYVTGAQLKKLGEYYAEAIHDNYGLDFDVLFGPAYKGIPLTVATTMAISELYGKEIRYCSNRKEVKDHGDTGILLGSKLKDGDRVVIIEDVTTSGKSIEETFPIIKAQADVTVKGLMVSLNRMEKGLSSDKSALDEIKEKYGFDTGAIVTMEEVVECLYNKPIDGEVYIDDEIKGRIDAYYETYGAK